MPPGGGARNGGSVESFPRFDNKFTGPLTASAPRGAVTPSSFPVARTCGGRRRCWVGKPNVEAAPDGEPGPNTLVTNALARSTLVPAKPTARWCVSGGARSIRALRTFYSLPVDNWQRIPRYHVVQPWFVEVIDPGSSSISVTDRRWYRLPNQWCHKHHFRRVSARVELSDEPAYCYRTVLPRDPGYHGGGVGGAVTALGGGVINDSVRNQMSVVANGVVTNYGVLRGGLQRQRRWNLDARKLSFDH